MQNNRPKYVSDLKQTNNSQNKKGNPNTAQVPLKRHKGALVTGSSGNSYIHLMLSVILAQTSNFIF
ncbi:hypothetical protein J2W97_003529 [Paenibacillus jamilae]|nr:hypothetical protein [Paenibacillus jamilae]